eukprot:1030423-Pleurochrysis_carterae.AAC.3
MYHLTAGPRTYFANKGSGGESASSSPHAPHRKYSARGRSWGHDERLTGRMQAKAMLWNVDDGITANAADGGARLFELLAVSVGVLASAPR